MNYKFTVSETITALTHCINGNLDDCDNCPYYRMPTSVSTKQCVQILIDNCEQIIAQLRDMMDISIDTRTNIINECFDKAKKQCDMIPQQHFNLANVHWYLDDVKKHMLEEKNG